MEREADHLLPSLSVISSLTRSDDRGAEVGTKYCVANVRTEGPDSAMLHMFFSAVSFFVVCTDEPFQAKPKSHCSRDSSRFRVKVFSRSALPGGGGGGDLFTGARPALGSCVSDYICLELVEA